VLGTIVLFACTAVFLAGAGVFYLRRTDAAVARVDLGNALTPKGKTIEKAGLGPTTIENYLLVGSDTGEGAQPGDPDYGGIGKRVGQRSDTIMILRFDPKTNKSALLSLPRDLYVPIYGTSGKNKINAAFNAGASTLIKTIQTDFGIPIHYYVEVDFQGFKRIVDAVGGVAIYFKDPARDRATSEGQGTRFFIQQPGCVNLDGVQALAYVRSRHYQTFTGGAWQDEGAADLGRIARQQDFLQRAFRKALEQASSSPLVATQLVQAAVSNLKVDKDLDIWGLANRLRKFGNGGVQTWTMPANGGFVGDQSVLRLDDSAAKPIIAYFRGEGPVPASTATPTDVTTKSRPATTGAPSKAAPADPAAACT
jgi:LCP family protein required for cell wall assembly